MTSFFYFFRFKEAWILAKTLDTHDAWLELGKKAITHLDIELGEISSFQLSSVIDPTLVC